MSIKTRFRAWRAARANTRALRQEIAEVSKHPRLAGGANWQNRLRIGFLIDWARGYPDRLALQRAFRQVGHSNNIVHVAGAILRLVEPGEAVMPHPHVYHLLEYGPGYHAQVAAHLHADEVALACGVYERLISVDPVSISAQMNLAELARRKGDPVNAVALLESARARDRPTSEWDLELDSALARLNPRAGALCSRVSELANAGAFEELDRVILATGNEQSIAVHVAVHSAFSDLEASVQRALEPTLQNRLAVRPPPTAYRDEARFCSVTRET